MSNFEDLIGKQVVRGPKWHTQLTGQGGSSGGRTGTIRRVNERDYGMLVVYVTWDSEDPNGLGKQHDYYMSNERSWVELVEPPPQETFYGDLAD